MKFYKIDGELIPAMAEYCDLMNEDFSGSDLSGANFKNRSFIIQILQDAI